MERTRARITQAAIDLHGSIGPAATTMSAVAERAGVTRATLYRHFPNEETLFMALWTTPLGMVLGAAVFALGITLSTPAFFSAIFATARPNERGAASGTASVFLDLAMGGGPILLGFAAQASGIPFAFGVAAAVALAGSGWILTLHYTSRRGAETISSSV